MREKLHQPYQREAAASYPDRTVVDHQLDISERAGLILREHRARDSAGGVQQQAAFVPRDQRASPQVSADEPRRPVVLVKGVPLVPQRHDVNGPAEQGGGEGRRGSRSARELRANRKCGTSRGWARAPRPGRTARGVQTIAGPPRTYMVSNPRAGLRLEEMRLPAASRAVRGVSAA